MKFEYQRKVASLNRQKKRGTNSDALEKIKAAVSHLHTRYIVDMQSMDSTVLEINRLRDDHLHPKLVQLVDGYVAIWKELEKFNFFGILFWFGYLITKLFYYERRLCLHT